MTKVMFDLRWPRMDCTSYWSVLVCVYNVDGAQACDVLLFFRLRSHWMVGMKGLQYIFLHRKTDFRLY